MLAVSLEGRLLDVIPPILSYTVITELTYLELIYLGLYELGMIILYDYSI